MDLRRRLIAQWQSWHFTIGLALVAITLSLLTFFVTDNFVMVEMRLILWKVETRLAWGLLVAAGLGFLIGLQVGRLRR